MFLHNKQEKCQCIIRNVEDEKFDFYPFSFLLYLTLLCIITTLVLYKYIHIQNNEGLINDKLYIDIIKRMHYGLYHNDLHLIDWIIVYNLILIACWESLFNFYRYFTTKYAAKYCYPPSGTVVFKNFSVYLVIFVVLCVAQIHIIYMVFPLVIGMYLGYNIFCTYSFSAIFISQYHQFAS